MAPQIQHKSKQRPADRDRQPLFAQEDGQHEQQKQIT
jgi:hypothetical protein